jgi:predicted nuclease of predicted toxin-antitoxin system
MKFKLDENLPLSALSIFRDNGFDVFNVREEGLTGCSDDHLISVCLKEKRVLVTLDLDFSDIRRYQPDGLNGIIVIRAYKQNNNYIISILKKIFPLLKVENLTGKLMIVEDDRIRIR